MKTLSRKVYMKWSDNTIVAVEILAETVKEFEARTGMVIEEGKSLICESFEILSETKERSIGNIMIEPTYTQIAELGSFVSQVKLITNNDIQSILDNDKTSLELKQKTSIKEGRWILDYTKEKGKDFVGFIELSKNTILERYNCFNNIAFIGEDEKLFIPTFISKKDEFQFDEKETVEDIQTKKIIVLFLGTDNCSYGQRFKTFEEAEEFVKLGHKCGMQKLRFYNS